ncbi:hypothetical protein M9435_002901 [Picochlorum sp. BPE23]|nr:hypothetical protein M9435_002901 [Picochlorum sp. BPE23]
MMMTKTRYSLAVVVLVLSLATSRGNPCSNEPLNYAGEFEGKLMNLKSLLTENSTVVFSPEVNWEIRLRPLLTGDATAIPRAYAGLKGDSGFGNLNESSVCLASPGNGALMDCSDDGEPSVLIWSATRVDEECLVVEAMVRYVEFWREGCDEPECAPTVASGIVRRRGFEEGSGVPFSAMTASPASAATSRFFSLVSVLFIGYWMASFATGF